MKKFLPTFLAYSLFAAAALWTAGFFLLPVADVSEASVFSYKTTNAFCLLFDVLPSVLLTSFLIASSLAFSGIAEKASGRFSVHTAAAFKHIMLAALATTFVASFGTLVMLPFENTKRQIMKEIPSLLLEYKNTAERYRAQKNPGAAKQYIKQATTLDPNDQKLRELERLIEAEEKEIETVRRAEENKSYIETDFNAPTSRVEAFDESGMSAAQMQKKARELFEAKDFFGAHYLSVQAARLFGTDNPSAQEARETAEEAWKKLQDARREDRTAGNIFFERKLAGYTALVSGDFEEAYYIFHELSQEDARKARDPDVIRYLAEAQKALLEQYFFIEETYDTSRFERAKNVYFSVRNKSGGTDIFVIRGVTDIAGTDGRICYLRELSIFSFDEYGKFTSSMATPYAKMTAKDIGSLDERTRESLGLDSSAKSVPFIMLRSVSKDSRAVKNEPAYTFKDGAENAGRGGNQVFVPIPYKDFSLILLSSAGNGNLNPFSLNRLARKAPDYGYSSEVFSAESLNRIFYPFMLLIILIFVATIAWNYRLSDGAVFKFKWVLILPTLNVVFYLVENLVEYLIKLFNFIFIAMAGTRMALFAGIAVYVFLLVAVSVIFLSRKKD